MQKLFLLLYSTIFSVFFCVPIMPALPTISPYFMQQTTAPVDDKVADACDNYLKNKDFCGFNIATIKDDFFWNHLRKDTYAFTVPTVENRTIFLSPRMITSIKQNLNKQRPIAIYDKFVLLHELGHLHPYGRACAKLQSATDLLQESGIFGLMFSSLRLLSDGLAGKKTPQKWWIAYLASASGIGTGAYIQHFKINPIKKTFKKRLFGTLIRNMKTI